MYTYITKPIIYVRLESQILHLNNSQRNKILADCLAPSENKVRRKVETLIQLTGEDVVALQAHWLHTGVSSFCPSPSHPASLPHLAESIPCYYGDTYLLLQLMSTKLIGKLHVTTHQKWEYMG